MSEPLSSITGEDDVVIPPALYRASDGITPVSSQSMIKSFRQCPREAYYKYALRLSPKVSSLPLERGKWVHSLLEAFYLGEDWKKVHKKYTKKFNDLFDEEKEKLGDLPREIEKLMESYFWFYGDPKFKGYNWVVHEVEFKVEAMMPNGHMFRGVVDMIIEDEYGIWLVDHKTHGRLPDWNYRMMDDQSGMYIWAAREMGIPVRGFIWNYISTTGFPKYKVLKNGSAFYKASIGAESCYPVFVKAVKAAKAENPDVFLAKPEDKEVVLAQAAILKQQRWQGPDSPGNSPYFRRDIIEKTDDLIERTLKPFMRTSETMHAYDFSDPDAVERNVNSCKGPFCSFKSLTMADMVSGNSDMIARREYKQGDPLAYQTKGGVSLGSGQ